MSEDQIKNSDKNDFQCDRRKKRSLTMSDAIGLDAKSDSWLETPKLVMLNPIKLTRSKTISDMIETDYNLETLTSVNESQNLSPLRHSEKRFNETVVLSSPPTQLERYPSSVKNGSDEKLAIENGDLMMKSPGNSDMVSTSFDKFRIDAISPMSNHLSTWSSNMSSPKVKLNPITTNIGVLSLHCYGGGRVSDEFRQLNSSNLCHKSTSLFKESYTVSESNDSLPMSKEQGWFSRNKYIVTYSLLIFFILCLIGGFVPAIVILANGTKTTVLNYFNSEGEDRYELLLELNKKLDNRPPSEDGFAANRGSFLNGFNRFEGINEKYKTDEEIFNLMNNPNFTDTTFYGLAYSPRDAMEPSCLANKRDILLDLAMLSRVTTRIRNYGMQCNQSDMILDSIQDLNLNMTLAMGVWIGDNDTINDHQLNEMKVVLKKYPRKLFEAIFIGNEVLFREDKSAQQLLGYAKSVKKFLIDLGYDDLPVATSEIGSLLTKEHFETFDMIGANVHPFFGGDLVEVASDWTIDFIKYQVEPKNENTRKEIVITEVGWPSDGGRYEGAVASLLNFQIFLDNYVCKAYQNKYGWYYFEAFDEPWKRVFYEDNNKWETQWGLFTVDRKFKQGIVLPKC
ncbi:uncharacterized protein PRCAT00006261001 [Priceomyces carsonii]|uniref:uncharacterized protein n=1 Tax=Priceomyces carsonii TaxID=28549 RepID=UPI002ED77F96|nr:unnamed protein product [Priceomyces carsonii]